MNDILKQEREAFERILSETHQESMIGVATIALTASNKRILESLLERIESGAGMKCKETHTGEENVFYWQHLGYNEALDKVSNIIKEILDE